MEAVKTKNSAPMDEAKLKEQFSFLLEENAKLKNEREYLLKQLHQMAGQEFFARMEYLFRIVEGKDDIFTVEEKMKSSQIILNALMPPAAESEAE